MAPSLSLSSKDAFGWEALSLIVQYCCEVIPLPYWDLRDSYKVSNRSPPLAFAEQVRTVAPQITGHSTFTRPQHHHDLHHQFQLYRLDKDRERSFEAHDPVFFSGFPLPRGPHWSRAGENLLDYRSGIITETGVASVKSPPQE